MRRISMVAFAVVFAALVATSPVAAQSGQLVVASNHTTDTDFNGADTLTNVSVEGSGNAANVTLDDDVQTTIEGFESGNLDDWTVVGGQKSNFTVQTSTVHDGTYAMQFSGDGPGADSIKNSNIKTKAYANISVWIYDTAFNDQRPDWRYRDGNGNFVITLSVDDGGESGDAGSLLYFDGNSWTDTGIDIAEDSWRKVDVHNIDYSNDQFDVTVYDDAGTSQGSASNLGFHNSASEIGELYVSGVGDTFYFDTFRGPARTADTGQYISANHSAEQVEEGFTNLTLTNAAAIVEWQYLESGSWKVANTSNFTTTANHTLDLSGHASATKWRTNVTFKNLSGSTTAQLHDEGVLFNASSPTLTDPYPINDKKLDNRTVNLSIQVNDSDFALAQSDSLTITWKNGTTDNQIDQQTVTSNGTYNATTTVSRGGTHKWYVTVDDSYGESDRSPSSGNHTFQAPHEIFIRNATSADNLITNANAEIDFFASDEIITKTDPNNDGKINLTDLPIDEKMVIEVSADGYHTRTVILDSLYEQEDVYLLNKSNFRNNETTFTLTDNTGDFDAATDPELLIERAINQSGTKKWRIIAGDEFGVDGFTATLKRGERHRLTVRNNDGDERILGSYANPDNETVDLEIGQLTFGVENETTYKWDANYLNQSGTEKVVFNFTDEDTNTTDLFVEIYERGNKSNTIHSSTTAGPLGSKKITETLTGDQTNKTWVVNWSATRDSKTIEGKLAVGARATLNTGLDALWKKTIAVGLLFVIAGLFGGFNVRVGAMIVPLVAGILWYVQWLPAEIGAGVILLAIMIALFYRTTTAEPRGI